MTAAQTLPRSEVRGVNWRPSRGAWETFKSFAGCKYYLGSYKTQEEAEAVVAAWTPSAEDLDRAAGRPPIKHYPYAPQPIHADGFPTLGRSSMTDEQVAYALSIAHELRGF